jgi:thiamine-monophosphate kinase
MPVTEFELIHRYFSRKGQPRSDIALGIGDDAALLNPPAEQQLVIAIDTLVQGIHFPTNTLPYYIGWKALAVNLSDLAAMGAEPAWFTLALTLPESTEAWLTEFSRGLFDLANQYGLTLVGGDTTRGPLTVTVQIAGYVPADKALLRAGASPGDRIFVTGSLGDATLALQLLTGQLPIPAQNYPGLLKRLNQPQPCIKEGHALRGIASCAIDISDGLLADLQHMLDASDVGAELYLPQIPYSTKVRQLLSRYPDIRNTLLSSGDDYELCFCVAPDKLQNLEQSAAENQFQFTEIGLISDTRELRCLDAAGQVVEIDARGYTHFAKEK